MLAGRQDQGLAAELGHAGGLQHLDNRVKDEFDQVCEFVVRAIPDGDQKQALWMAWKRR